MQSTKSSVKLKLDPKVFDGTADLVPVRTNGAAEKELYDKFLSTILDQQKDYPDPTPLVSLVSGSDMIPLLTLKSFSLFQGKQKSKKTITLALIVAAYIRHMQSNEEIYFEGIGDGTVLWFDCEQGQSYAARTMKMVLRVAGIETSPRLMYSDLRQFTPKERMQIIEAAIQSTDNVKLVIIDGLVDLMNDFMDAAEAHQVITKLLALCSTYDLHIAGVLHQNKADKNARAHIGSIGSQKCEIEISVEVDAEDRARSIVTCANPRGMPFEPFAIRWDKGSLPCIDQDYRQAGTKKEIASVRNYENGKRVVDTVFKPFAALSYTEAGEHIASVEKVSISTANRRIKDYVAWGFIEQSTDGKYRKKV